MRQRFRSDLVSVRASSSQMMLSAGVRANRSMVLSYHQDGYCQRRSRCEKDRMEGGVDLVQRELTKYR